MDTEVVKAGAGYSGHVHVELTLVRCLPMRLGARKCPVQAPACIGWRLCRTGRGHGLAQGA